MVMLDGEDLLGRWHLPPMERMFCYRNLLFPGATWGSTPPHVHAYYLWYGPEITLSCHLENHWGRPLLLKNGDHDLWSAEYVHV